MTKQTKTILKTVAIIAIVAFGYNLIYKKEENTSGFLGLSFGKNKKRKLKDEDSNPTNTILGGVPQCVTTCEYTNKSNGSVSVYDGACNSVKANQGWSTVTRCSGGGSNTIMSAT